MKTRLLTVFLILILALLFSACSQGKAPTKVSEPPQLAAPDSAGGGIDKDAGQPAAAPSGPVINEPVSSVGSSAVAGASFDGDLRQLPAVPQEFKDWENEEEDSTVSAAKQAQAGASGLAPKALVLAPMPAPGTSFDGMNFTGGCGSNCGSGWPPDINGEVGLNHYIEAVNSGFAVFSKSGTLLTSFTENALWSGAGIGTPCDSHNQGDPVAMYDQFDDRWFLTDFGFAISGGNPVAPFYECIAVSKTSDPVSGGWWLYAFQVDPGGPGQPAAGVLGDYPKFGLWTDCLYMGTNGFNMPAGSYAGAGAWTFDYKAMERGATAHYAVAWLPFPTNDVFTLIPANLLGNAPGGMPPAGTPEYIVSESQTAFSYEVRKFTPGANCGSGGTLSAFTNVSQSSYTVPGQNIVPQPGTTNTLDSLGDRLMQKVQYRKVGSAESLWVVHSTLNPSIAAPQWGQINVTGGTIATTPVQQQIFSPDTTLWRWMGSIAADNAGNAALGYSTSNGAASNFPSIAYAGRLAGDPLNQLPQSERQMTTGLGSQTNSCGGAPCHRWGDYTSMSVDPADDCTFWYANEYYKSTANGAAGNWGTRIGSFRFPPANCTSSPASGTPHTVIFDGGVGADWVTSAERLGTMGGFSYFATWDASSLLLGIKGAVEGAYTYGLVLDSDPASPGAGNTGTPDGQVCAAGFNANRKGDFALLRSTAGVTTKQLASGGHWAAWTPGASSDALDAGNNAAEFKLSWADVGLNTTSQPVGVYLYVCSGASLVSAWPPENLQSGTPTLNVETQFNTHDAGRMPTLEGRHVGNQTFSVSNGAGPVTALNSYVLLANVSGLTGACTLDAAVDGNTTAPDPLTIRRDYTFSTGTGCTGLSADLSLKYEDGTAADNAPSELGSHPENNLVLLRYDSASLSWIPTASSRDTTNNTVTSAAATQFDTSWAQGETGSPALSISKSVRTAHTPALPGDVVTYTVVVTNPGISAAAGVHIQDILPAGLTGAGLNITTTVPGSGKSTFMLTPVVNSSPAPYGQVIQNTASFAWNGQSGNAQASFSVIGAPFLSIGKSVVMRHNPALPGDVVTYTVVVSNSGPSAAAGVHIQDALPAGLTGAGLNITTTVPGSGRATFVLTPVVNSSPAPYGQVIQNTASFSGNGQTGSAQASFSVVGAPLLSIAKSAHMPHTPALPGDVITFTVVIHNQGPSDANSVLVTDTLPADLTGSNLSAFVNVRAGAAYTLTYTATVAANSSGHSVTNTAHFSWNGQAGESSFNFLVAVIRKLYMPLLIKNP